MNKERLSMLYNTLCLIEVKGVNAKYMADCLKFIEKDLNADDSEEAAEELNTDEAVEELNTDEAVEAPDSVQSA